MQLLKMRREEKLDLILLCRYLERQAGARFGVKYSKNIGRDRETVNRRCPRSAYLLRPKNLLLREHCVFYSQGWGWRVRKDWREVVKQIECTNSSIYEGKD